MTSSKQFLNNEEHKKAIKWFSLVVFWIIAGFFLSDRYGFYFNLSDSFKEDVFIVKKNFLQTEINNGSIVTKKIDFENPYVERGKKIVKKVACMEGELLETQGVLYFCNKKLIATAQQKDSKGREINQFIFNGTLPKDKIFLTGESPRSFDSRYFGLIDRKDIVEVGIWRF